MTRRALVIGGSLGAYIEAQLKVRAERTEAERQPPPEYLMREVGSMAVDIRALTAGAEG